MAASSCRRLYATAARSHLIEIESHWDGTARKTVHGTDALVDVSRCKPHVPRKQDSRVRQAVVQTCRSEFNDSPHYDHDNGHDIRGVRGQTMWARLVTIKLKACFGAAFWSRRACALACGMCWHADCCALPTLSVLVSLADIFRFPIVYSLVSI